MSDSLQLAASYHVDVTVVIDATGSMKPVIDWVRDFVGKLPAEIDAALARERKKLTSLRIRPILFRDLFEENEQAISAGDFFTIPGQEQAFREFVSDVVAGGGGDDPESGLEALGVAIDTTWQTTAPKNRHVIVLLTDDEAHPLEKGADLPYRPMGVPKSLPELAEKWASMDLSTRRLLLFAPDAYPWAEIGREWEGVAYFPSQAGMGLQEHTKDAIFNIIAKSAAQQRLQ